MERLHGIFLVEEVFARDLDDDDEEEEARQAVEAQLQERAASPEQSGAEVKPRPKEKLLNVLAERAQVFNDVVQINRMLKKLTISQLLITLIGTLN